MQSTESSFSNNIPVFIKQAESRIVRTASLPVFRKNVTGAMTSGNQYLGIPSDFLSPYSLALVNSSSYEYLVNKDVYYIRELYPVAATTGIPKYYALFDNSSFIIGPTPNAGFSSELHYHYKPQSIVDASDGTSWLGTNAEDVLLYGSLIEAYTFLKGEPDLLGLYQQRHDTALELLIRESDGRDRTDAYRTGQPSLVA